MASSRTSPGPHDRRDPEAGRATCIKINSYNKKKCKRFRTTGSKLCKFHKEQAELEEKGLVPTGKNYGKLGGPEHSLADGARAGITTSTRKKGASNYVITEQAREALRKLGQATDDKLDPKRVLLDTVNAAWRQRQIWEAMLAQVPEEDWQFVGTPPIPGSVGTAKGARIEVITKFLNEATKVAARTSKLAIDAGIEERLVRLAEEQSALIADTVRAGLIAGIGALRLSPVAEKAAIEAALGSAATHLRLLAAGNETLDGVAIRVVNEGD